MRKLLFALLLSVTSYGAFPVLEIKVGGLDPENKIKKIETCIIYSDHKDIKVSDILKLSGKAATKRIAESLFIRPQVPSYQASGYTTAFGAPDPKKGVRYQKVLLKEAAGSLKKRKGAEAKKLIEIAEDLCDIKDPAE